MVIKEEELLKMMDELYELSGISTSVNIAKRYMKKRRINVIRLALYSSIKTACITSLLVPLLLQVDKLIILSSASIGTLKS